MGHRKATQMRGEPLSRSRIDADVQTALYQALIRIYEGDLEARFGPAFGHGHTACQAMVAQLSPVVMADLLERLKGCQQVSDKD